MLHKIKTKPWTPKIGRRVKLIGAVWIPGVENQKATITSIIKKDILLKLDKPVFDTTGEITPSVQLSEKNINFIVI